MSEGFSVALVEQPYRVAGKRAPAPAKRLDEAWVTVIEHFRENELAGAAAGSRRALAGRARRLPHPAPRRARRPSSASPSRCSRRAAATSRLRAGCLSSKP